MHSSADVGHIAAQVSQIAAAPDSPTERAAALLEPLQRMLPFDGAWLALLDEDRRGHRSLVSTGWDRRTAAYLNGPVLVDEIERLGMTRSYQTLRVADFPSHVSELRSWAECLLPAGFREGLGMCLFSADGRHLGFLGLFTGSPTVPRAQPVTCSPPSGRHWAEPSTRCSRPRPRHGWCAPRPPP